MPSPHEWYPSHAYALRELYLMRDVLRAIVDGWELTPAQRAHLNRWRSEEWWTDGRSPAGVEDTGEAQSPASPGG